MNQSISTGRNEMETTDRGDGTDMLLHKAVDKEEMTDRELRDFAAALIASPCLSEEFVELQRIVASAGKLPKEEPPRGFVDRVMCAVGQCPRPAPLFPKRAVWGVAAAATAALYLAALFMRGAPSIEAWLAQTGEWVWGKATGSLWEPLQFGWDSLTETYRAVQAGTPVRTSWIVGLTLLVVVLNLVLARKTRLRV
jgi:hypothetical protein